VEPGATTYPAGTAIRLCVDARETQQPMKRTVAAQLPVVKLTAASSDAHARAKEHGHVYHGTVF
jgi:hypothetical protein